MRSLFLVFFSALSFSVSVFAQSVPDPLCLITKPNDVKVVKSLDTTVFISTQYLCVNKEDTTKMKLPVTIKVTRNKMSVFHIETHNFNLTEIACFYRDDKISHISARSNDKFVDISLDGWVRIKNENGSEVIYYK